MTILTSLKLVSAQQKANITPAMHRRTKLSQKLLEQIEMAKALQEGRVYAPTKSKLITNEEGQRVAVESEKRLKQWWWTAANGKLNLSVRYGAKVIELAKGKNAVEVADLKQVVETLELINQAINAGELDTAIEAVSGNVKKVAK
jgi:hypothetical protein